MSRRVLYGLDWPPRSWIVACPACEAPRYHPCRGLGVNPPKRITHPERGRAWMALPRRMRTALARWWAALTWDELEGLRDISLARTHEDLSGDVALKHTRRRHAEDEGTD